MAQKADGTTPYEKQLHLFTILLYSREKQSLGDLAGKLNCSKQTILRILPMLEKFGGGCIHEEKSGCESVYWMEKPEKINLNLNADGLRELMICKNFLSHIIPESIKKEMDIALLRATEHTSDKSFSLDGFYNIGTTITKGQIDYTKFQAQYDALVNAIAEKRVCRAEYKAGEKLKTRSIAPMNIVILNGTIYIRGWIVTEEGKPTAKYKKPLTLSLHKIIKIEPEERMWQRLAKIDNSGFGLLDTGRIKAAVKFIGYVTEYVKDRSWSEDQIIEECENGIILTFTASSRPELVSWVLSFGAQAELLEPEEVRREIMENVKGALEKYNVREDHK